MTIFCAPLLVTLPEDFQVSTGKPRLLGGYPDWEMFIKFGIGAGKFVFVGFDEPEFMYKMIELFSQVQWSGLKIVKFFEDPVNRVHLRTNWELIGVSLFDNRSTPWIYSCPDSHGRKDRVHSSHLWRDYWRSTSWCRARNAWWRGCLRLRHGCSGNVHPLWIETNETLGHHQFLLLF